MPHIRRVIGGVVVVVEVVVQGPGFLSQLVPHFGTGLNASDFVDQPKDLGQTL